MIMAVRIAWIVPEPNHSTKIPIDDRDGVHGPLVLGQLRGRNRPVAVAKFAEQLTRRLNELRTLPTIEADGRQSG
jgi:hypothetical protein